MREEEKVTRTGWWLNHHDAPFEGNCRGSYTAAVPLSLSVFHLSLFKLCLLPGAFVSKPFLFCCRFKDTIVNAKYGGHTEAVRRLLGQLPISAQSYSGSPYLDLSLFSYDDKWVSVMERPKTCGDHPIRYGTGQGDVCEESSVGVAKSPLLNHHLVTNLQEDRVDQCFSLLTSLEQSVCFSSPTKFGISPCDLLPCLSLFHTNALVPPFIAAQRGSGCLPSCAGGIPFEHVGLAGEDRLVCPMNKISAGLGVIHNASGIDFAIFRLALFTFLTQKAALLFVLPFFL